MLINKLLNIKYPIIQGAMYKITDGKFAAAVSNAGGLGIIATGGLDLLKIKEEIRICKSLTNNPFGVNVYMLSPIVNEIVDLIIEEGIKIVTTGATSSLSIIKKLKEAKIMVFPVTSSVVLAKRMARYGVDGIIVEGMESGGHVGYDTTMSLVVQMKREIDLPIIAAGGIATGRQLVALLAMGAEGIQVGTVLLASEEAKIHDNYKKMIINARDNDTVILGNGLDRVRVYKNKAAKAYLEQDIKDGNQDINRMELAINNGDLENGIFVVGQIAGAIDEILPVEKIFSKIIKEAIEIEGELNNNFSLLKKCVF